MPINNLNPQLSSFNPTEDVRSTAATVTSVSVSSTSTSLLAANSSRRFCSFFNAGSTTIFVVEGTTGSATTYAFQLPPGFYWVPDGPDIYTGAYAAITASGTSNIMVTQA